MIGIYGSQLLNKFYKIWKAHQNHAIYKKNCVEFESAQINLKVHGAKFGDHLGLVKVSLMINYMNERISSM